MYSEWILSWWWIRLPRLIRGNVFEGVRGMFVGKYQYGVWWSSLSTKRMFMWRWAMHRWSIELLELGKCNLFEKTRSIFHLWNSFKEGIMSNGRCVVVDRSDRKIYEQSGRTKSEGEKCSYLLQCSLTEGREKDCPCRHCSNCVD